MYTKKILKKSTIWSVVPILVVLLSFGVSWSARTVSQDTRQPLNLELVVGKSTILKSHDPVKRVSVADPEIADLVILSPYDIHVIAKAVGGTNVVLWQDSKPSVVYDLSVTCDVSRLKQKLHEILPDEKGIRVVATSDSISLSGIVSSEEKLSQVISLAEAYAPDGKVRNMLQVAGVQQVMLEVRVAEMSRSLANKIGVNFSYVSGNSFGVSLLDGLTQLVDPDSSNIGSGGPFGLYVSPSVNALFRFSSGNATWTGFFDALKSDGLVKILAEPTLISLSGQQANFLAGGEYPVPVPQGLGTVGIDYKPYGVGLSFTPTVLSENKISLNVTPEVSELDFSTAVAVGGFVVPGLTTRKASTVVELADGQSFAVAGLISERVRTAVDKFPLLGDIPILGALFRSTKFQKNETELVIIVTPHLVKPLNMAEQTLPTDYYIEPSDMEFYLWGLIEGREKAEQRTGTIEGKMDGDFGHVMPMTE
jgi:pilus assembly protein CpaC